MMISGGPVVVVLGQERAERARASETIGWWEYKQKTRENRRVNLLSIRVSTTRRKTAYKSRWG